MFLTDMANVTNSTASHFPTVADAHTVLARLCKLSSSTRHSEDPANTENSDASDRVTVAKCRPIGNLLAKPTMLSRVCVAPPAVPRPSREARSVPRPPNVRKRRAAVPGWRWP